VYPPVGVVGEVDAEVVADGSLVLAVGADLDGDDVLGPVHQSLAGGVEVDCRAGRGHLSRLARRGGNRAVQDDLRQARYSAHWETVNTDTASASRAAAA